MNTRTDIDTGSAPLRLNVVGGVKKSGHGREKGFEALYEFSASKTIVLSHG
jgi:acyl-CoA reductase-like NAD-dependent aldehyde dehydrogenase